MEKRKSSLKEINRLAGEINACTECGYCTFWCPLYQEEQNESTVARGKNKLIKAMAAGKIDFSDEIFEQLNKCMLCGTCTEHCSVQAKTHSLIVAARADRLEEKEIGFPFNIIFQWLLPRRTLFGNVVRVSSWFQKVLAPKTEGTIRHLSFFLSALGRERRIPSIAHKFLRQLVPVINSPKNGSPPKMRVGFFTGCMMDFVFPNIGVKIINFLNKNSVEVVVPKEQVCCGAPVYLGAGDFPTGRKLADINLRAFDQLDYVVTGCATCASALRDYKSFLGDNDERLDAYEKFGRRVYDITQFLVDVMKVPEQAYQTATSAQGMKVTWHDSCHLNRHLGVKKQPRAILNSIKGISFIEMTKPDWCCGMAGTFSLKHYDLSKKIALKKINSIKETGADAVITACPGCMVQFLDNISREKMPQKVMHIIELFE